MASRTSDEVGGCVNTETGACGLGDSLDASSSTINEPCTGPGGGGWWQSSPSSEWGARTHARTPPWTEERERDRAPCLLWALCAAAAEFLCVKTDRWRANVTGGQGDPARAEPRVSELQRDLPYWDASHRPKKRPVGILSDGSSPCQSDGHQPLALLARRVLPAVACLNRVAPLPASPVPPRTVSRVRVRVITASRPI